MFREFSSIERGVFDDELNGLSKIIRFHRLEKPGRELRVKEEPLFSGIPDREPVDEGNNAQILSLAQRRMS